MAKTILKNIPNDFSRREVVVGLVATSMAAALPIGAESAIAAVESETVMFLDISSKLTGIALDKTYMQLADTIRGALTDQEAGHLADLAARLDALPQDPTSANIKRALAGADEETMALAQKLAKVWYTGKIEASDGTETVITYDDALVWQACDFSKPPTTCGGLFGYWSEPYKGEA